MPARQRPNGQLWTDYVSGEMPTGRAPCTAAASRQARPRRARAALQRPLPHRRSRRAHPRRRGLHRPARSEVDIVQAVGRAIRLADDKTVGTIVIPVFIDTDEDPEIVLDDSAFKPVWDVLKALRSHDEDLAEQLDELRRLTRSAGRKATAAPQDPLRHPRRSASISPAHSMCASSSRPPRPGSSGSGFWNGLSQRNGHARVPHVLHSRWLPARSVGHHSNATITAEAPLTPIASADLRNYPAGHGTPSPTGGRRASVDSCDYVERHGDARVPQSFTVDGYRLGAWVNSQRTDHANGALDADVCADSRNCPAGPGTPVADRWEEGFRSSWTTSSATVTPVSRCPTQSMAPARSVGRKATQQLTPKAPLTPIANGDSKRCPAGHGTCTPTCGRRVSAVSCAMSNTTVMPASLSCYMVDGYKLGWWVNVQRNNYAEGTLDADRQRRLEDLPGWTWDTRADQWEEGFRRLSEYVERTR